MNALMLVALLLAAEPAADPIDAAVRQAWANDAALTGATARVVAGASLEDPELHLDSDSLTGADLRRPYVGLSWRPPQPGVLAAERRRHAAATGMSAAALRARRDAVEAAVHAAWLETLAAEVRLVPAQRVAAAETARAAVVARQAAAGVRTEIDGAASGLRQLSATQRVERLAEAARATRARLAQLAGAPPEPLPPPSSPTATEPASDAAEQTARSARAAALADAELAEAQRWPWFAIEIGGRGLADGRDDLEGKLTLNLPLFRPAAEREAARGAALAWERQAERLAAARSERQALLRDAWERADVAAAAGARALAAATTATRTLAERLAAAGADPGELAELELRLADLAGEQVERDLAAWTAALALRRTQRPLAGMAP